VNRRIGWALAALFWTSFGILSGLQVWLSMIAHHHSVPRLLGYHVLVWDAWFLATLLIFWLARRFPVIPPRATSVLIHFVAACAIGVLHILWWIVLLLWMKPYDRMTAPAAHLDLSQILSTRLPLEFALYGFVLGVGMAIDFYERYRERSVQAAQLETLLAATRLHTLEAQLQPHFLFNAMNAISSLVRNGRNDEAVTMISGLSELLRYTLDHAGDQHVALEDEVAVLRRYLEIQRVRFPDRMCFDIDVAPNARRGAVPALLLQPLAENAVRHGIARSAGPGCIEVRAFRSDGHLRIDIFNSGALGEPSNGIGVRNTAARLQLLYGDAGTFNLSGTERGVLASVSIPWSEVA